MISVLVVNDHDFMRWSLSTLIDTESDLVLIGTAPDGRGGVALTQELRPDVVLMDVRLPDLDGVGAAQEITGRQQDARVVILSASCRGLDVREALAAGACGYLLKGDPPEVLMDGIRLAAGGGQPLAPVAQARPGR
jgi:DNA-binding NarL/FixJ family response regulator